MPIYEYACTACGHQLDALQKLADAPLVDCPACGAPQLKRQMSAPSFRLKGGGWYETDFKNDKRRNIAESDSKGGGAEGKAADAKPAASGGEKSGEKGGGSGGKSSDTGGKSGESGGKSGERGASKGGEKAPAKSDAATAPSKKPAGESSRVGSGKTDSGKAGGVA